jgi:hypothetical protein
VRAASKVNNRLRQINEDFGERIESIKSEKKRWRVKTWMSTEIAAIISKVVPQVAAKSPSK